MAKIDAMFYERAKERFGIKFENVLDIGAAAGDWSNHVKSFYPDAKFTLIEPNKLHNERLKSLGKVHNVYLSDEVTEKDFYVCKDPFQQTGNGFYKEKYFILLFISHKYLKKKFSQKYKNFFKKFILHSF